MGDIAQASLVHLLPEYEREKESNKMREDHKAVLGDDKNIDININDVFHEKKGGRYAGIIHDMETEKKMKKSALMECEKKLKRTKKCVIS